MPLIDLNNSLNTFKVSEYDTTIIGAGAAGILLAVKLTQAGQKVLLIESGNFNENVDKQSLNNVVQTGKFLSNAIWGRKRVLGGTTTAWGGQSLPFTPFDFVKKKWIPLSGWPISYKELEPYYSSANAFMNIDTLNYHDEIFHKIKIKEPLVDKNLINFHVAKWANEPNFFILYKSFLEQYVTILYNAQLVELQKDDNNTIYQIIISNFKKEHFKLPINKLILTSGTIETIRILLTNDVVSKISKQWIGKCFMEHPCIEIGKVISANTYNLQRIFNTHFAKDKKYSIRLSLSDSIQSKYELLNCSASLMFKHIKNKVDIYTELKMFKNDYQLNRLLKITRCSPLLFKSVFAFFKHNFYYKANTEAVLVLMVEQEPSLESYVSIDNKKDVFGVPLAKLNWHISYKTWSTVLKISEIITNEFKRLNLGKVDINPLININNKSWSQSLSDVNHHMGGTRISATENMGVVDSDLKVWGVNNLYICSCSVFPTSSHSNPTLTMLALGIRLSDHIQK